MNYKALIFSLATSVFVMQCGCSGGEKDSSETTSLKGSSSDTISSQGSEGLDEDKKENINVGLNDKGYLSAGQSESKGWDVNAGTDAKVNIKNAVGESEKQDFSYFDDAVFVGDSVTLKLKYYATERRSIDPGFLGKAQFLCSGSLGSANALWEVSQQSVHPMYKGQKNPIQDSIVQMGAKKIYIMLGVNDVALYGIDESINNMSELISKILDKVPDAKIYVQSATPIVKGKEVNKFNNGSIQIYNNKLSELCEQKGYNFIDVASVMKDEQGYLKAEYCSDPSGPSSLGIHFTPKACEVWVDYLLTHTK